MDDAPYSLSSLDRAVDRMVSALRAVKHRRGWAPPADDFEQWIAGTLPPTSCPPFRHRRPSVDLATLRRLLEARHDAS